MAEGVEREAVLVTGASGYIATHLIKLLLEDGVYRVIGTVRNLEDKAKTQPIYDLVPLYSKFQDALKLCQADLTNKDSWVEAVRGCKYVYHVASPFPGGTSELTPEQQQERVIKPAVEGTLNVLEACATVGGVKRVVLTSSMAAICSGTHGNPGKPKDYVYTEADWSDESACSAYELSKTKAEKAAWEFMEKLDEDKKFELAVVNPAYVQGPLLSAVSGVGTQLLLKDMLNGKIPAVPDLNFCLVDVRDVARLHKAVMESPGAAGMRHIAGNVTVSYREAAAIVKEEFGSQGYSIPSMSLPKVGMWVFKFFNKAAKETYDIWGVRFSLSVERMKALGVEPMPIRDTILDTCYSLIDLGLVVKKPNYRGRSQATGGANGEDQPTTTEVEKPETGEAETVGDETKERPAGEKPTEGEDKPIEREEKPVENEEKPAENEEKPAENEEKPAEGEETPAESGGTTVTDEKQLTEDTEKLAKNEEVEASAGTEDEPSELKE